MNIGDFECLVDLVKRRSGVTLPPSKTQLAISRLAPVARRYGFRKTEQLLAELHRAPEELARAVTEAMMIHETSFFRDKATFEYFRGVMLPSLLSAHTASRKLRIWCAACSTGQEPYSLAMILNEARIAPDWRIDILATDISSEAIARAELGRYSQYEMGRGLSAQLLLRYFVEDDDRWRIGERMRAMVEFRQFNLLDNFGWLGEIDIVFCRNVLLYFDPAARQTCLEKMATVLADDGYLVLGGQEMRKGIGAAFNPADDDAQSVFRKVRAASYRPLALAG